MTLEQNCEVLDRKLQEFLEEKEYMKRDILRKCPRQKEVCLAWARNNKEARAGARNNNNRNKVANFC